MRELGIRMACAEMGVMPSSFATAQGLASALEGKKSASVKRLILKAAHDLFTATGRGHEAPAWHLHFITKAADWNPHYEDVVHHVIQVLKVMEPLQKQAFTVQDALGGAGTLGRTALYGSMLGGGGLGALYWLLSRHANQDEADIESMDKQRQYYQQLSKELSDSMRRKYQYEQSPAQPA